MITNTAEVKELERIAQQVTPEQARQQLAQIERQKQILLERNEAEYERLRVQATSALEKLKSRQLASDDIYENWLHQADAIFNDRLYLKREAQATERAFLAMVEFGLRNGYIEGDGTGTWDHLTVRGIAQDEVKALNGGKLLLAQTFSVAGEFAQLLYGEIEKRIASLIPR